MHTGWWIQKDPPRKIIKNIDSKKGNKTQKGDPIPFSKPKLLIHTSRKRPKTSWTSLDFQPVRLFGINSSVHEYDVL